MRPAAEARRRRVARRPGAPAREDVPRARRHAVDDRRGRAPRRRCRPPPDPLMMRAVEVLRQRNFRFLFAARTISFFGTNLAPIAVAFAVLGLTNSATDVGLSFAAWTLAQISTLLVGGDVAGRLPRRRVMIASDAANLCIRAAMGTIVVAGSADVRLLIALQVVGGVATAFYSPASSGLVPQTVPAGPLQQAHGFMSVARYLAFPLRA